FWSKDFSSMLPFQLSELDVVNRIRRAVARHIKVEEYPVRERGNIDNNSARFAVNKADSPATKARKAYFCISLIGKYIVSGCDKKRRKIPKYGKSACGARLQIPVFSKLLYRNSVAINRRGFYGHPSKRVMGKIG